MKNIFVFFVVFFFIGCDGGGTKIVELNETTPIEDELEPDIDIKESFTYVVKKTGQSVSYDSEGEEIGYLPDDGFFQLGKEPIYTRASQSVIDELTHLQWQNNNDVSTKTKSWSEAKIYCDALVLDGYDDWRLPTLMELTTLVDYSHTGPAINREYFYNVSDDQRWYWSASSFKEHDENGWCVDFVMGKQSYFYKENPNHLRCVRDVE